MKNLRNTTTIIIKTFIISAMILAGVLVDSSSSLAASTVPIDTSFVVDCRPPITGFTVRAHGGRVFLNWYVKGVTEESTYLILRSANGMDFTNIGDRKGVASPYDLKILNCFIDKSPIAGTSYYQLVRINADLSTTISGVVNLNNNTWQTSDLAGTY